MGACSDFLRVTRPVSVTICQQRIRAVRLGFIEVVQAVSIAVAVEPSTDTVVLKTLQLIRVLKGQPETITVDLPEGYELLDVKGDAIQDPQIDPDEPSRVHLPLIAGTTDTATPIEILWTLQGELPASGSQLVLEGFLVEGARYQTGHIAMKLLDNYRSTRKLGRFVHRINVRGLPRGPNLTSLFGEDVTSAWEILRQHFRGNAGPQLTHLGDLIDRLGHREALLAGHTKSYLP